MKREEKKTKCRCKYWIDIILKTVPEQVGFCAYKNEIVKEEDINNCEIDLDNVVSDDE